MTSGLLWFILALPLLLLVLWAWRRLDVTEHVGSGRSDLPDEPCWTEQIATDGRLSFGRYGCYHAELAEADARARVNEASSRYA